MGNPFFLAPTSEPVNVHSGCAQNEQTHSHDTHLVQNLEPHCAVVAKAKEHSYLMKCSANLFAKQSNFKTGQVPY